MAKRSDSGTDLIPRSVGIAWTVVICSFILTPFIVMLIMSFTDSPFLRYPWDETAGVSLRWYRRFFENEAFKRAFWNSLKLAVITSVLTLAIACMAAMAIVRYTFRLRSALNTGLMSPLFMPNVMIALALLIYTTTELGWGSGLTRMLVGHLVITMPFALATIVASLTGFDLNQEYAAYDLGATRWRAFRSVTYPQVKSGFFAAAVMAFIVSFDNVALSLFLVGPKYSTLPVEIYSYAIEELSPLAPAAAMVMTGFSLIMIVVIEKTFGVQKLLGASKQR